MRVPTWRLREPAFSTPWVEVMRPKAELVMFNCGVPKLGVLPRLEAEPSSRAEMRSVMANFFWILVDNTVVLGPTSEPGPT